MIKNSDSRIELPLIEANYKEYQSRVKSLQNKSLIYPRNISIETFVVCNAQCKFCAYPNSPRKGEKMSTQLFLKIVNELLEIPLEHQFGITLARINEPLLDKRMQYFSEVIQDILPNAHQSFWSNGTMLNRKNLDWIGKIKNAVINVSLNSFKTEEHYHFMGIDLDSILSNLDYLNKLLDRGQYIGTVIINAPFLSEIQANEVTNFCNERWPSFKLGLRPVFTWRGGGAGHSVRDNLEYGRLHYNIASVYPCGQWFDLHILANGYTTNCCINEEGYTDERYNIEKNNCLDIYGLSIKKREELPDRGKFSECINCYHLG